MNKNVFLFLLMVIGVCVLCGCMSDEVDAGRGPTPGIINITY